MARSAAPPRRRRAPVAADRADDPRSETRITSLSPDHTSLTAQTLTSTNPSGSATARITSSVTSDGTFEAFFGHDTHTYPAGASDRRRVARRFASAARFVTNTCAAATEPPARAVRVTPAGSSPSQVAYPRGAPSTSSRSGAFRPSFWTSGVPE